jgi:hypothetical protein
MTCFIYPLPYYRPVNEDPAKGTAADAYTPEQYRPMMTNLYMGTTTFFWQ